MLSVKTPDRDAQDGIGSAFPLNHIVLRLPGDAVLWTEECGKGAAAAAVEDFSYEPEI
jgi:hypothetical protein